MKTGTEINHKRILFVCGAAALILIIIAPFVMRTSIQKTLRLQSSGVQATAEIISLDAETTASSERAIISFSDQSGGVQTMPLGYYTSDMYVGMKIPILYDPANTSSIMYIGDNSFIINYGAGVLMLVSALILGFAAVMAHIKLRRC